MRIARLLFVLSASILVVLAAATIFRSSSSAEMTGWYKVYAVLMFGDAAAMAVCAWLLNRENNKKWVFWVAAAVPGVNIILTIFDQFGLADLLFVGLNFVTLAALFVGRREILPQ